MNGEANLTPAHERNDLTLDLTQKPRIPNEDDVSLISVLTSGARISPPVPTEGAPKAGCRRIVPALTAQLPA